jgi:peptidyl-prolyl cis-trans isomerase A (cyclophilin A)/peptidyl-prolyl cis-trans isomerase B (cyclophilin B)
VADPLRRRRLKNRTQQSGFLIFLQRLSLNFFNFDGNIHMKTSIFIALAAFAISTVAVAANPEVELKTNMGTITLELYADKAPKSVENFIQYVNDGHYKGTIFHRVINGFMVQGGGFTADFAQKKTRAPVQNEANNGVRNDVGTIAMARTSDPQSATAQFFINHKNNDFLNFTAPTPQGWGYTVFGRVVKGMDVVNKIAALETGPMGPFQSDVPRKPVVIEDAKLVSADKPAAK